LDLILTNCDDRISSLSVHSHNSYSVTSDHHLISFDISTDIAHSLSDNGPTAYVYNPAKGACDYDGLNNYLANFDSALLYNTTDVQHTWSIIKQCLTTAIDLFIPK